MSSQVKKTRKKKVNKAVEIYKKNSNEKDEEYLSSDIEDYSNEEDEGKEGYRKGGYHPVKIGEIFHDRYKVVQKLGWGHFSTVWLCVDIITSGRFGALKVVKSAKHYTDAALDEIKILRTITAGDSSNSKCCVRLLDDFQHIGPNGKHICMLLELLGSNLLDLIKRFDYRGIPLRIVKSICKQILIGLNYLHTACKVIHTDLKPENVLLYQVLPKGTLSEKSTEKYSGDELELERSSGNGHELGDVTSRNAIFHSSTGRLSMKDSVFEQQPSSNLAESNSIPNATESSLNITLPLVETLSISNEKLSVPPNFADGFSRVQAKTPCESNHQIEAIPFQAVENPLKSNVNSAIAEKVVSPSEQNPLIQVFDVDCNKPDTYRVKIADFGNACWLDKQFTSDIQTRQYRAPEVILGHKYNTSVDMWSMGCMAFELITGDLLFEPKRGETFDKNDDHLAQMIELLGKMPKKFALGGKYSKEFFNRKGELKYIRNMQLWSLEDILLEKYHFPKEEAKPIADFIMPMLRFLPEKRATAAEMLLHPWIQDVSSSSETERSRQC